MKTPSFRSHLPKWFGLALCLIELTMLVAGLRWEVGYNSSNGAVVVACGALILETHRPSSRAAAIQGWYATRSTGRIAWWFDWRLDTPGFLVIPLWLAVIATAALSLLLFIRSYRASGLDRRNLCPRCAYSLLNLPPNSPCPECGHTQGT